VTPLVRSKVSASLPGHGPRLASPFGQTNLGSGTHQCHTSFILTRYYSHMTAADSNNASQSIPVLLLKTRSSPGDAYEELFSTSPADGGLVFEPRFLPVLEHRFKNDGLARLRELLHARQIGAREGCLYGGLIFTSQRAVEAFAEVVAHGKGPSEHLPLAHLPPVTPRLTSATSRRSGMASLARRAHLQRRPCHH